MENQLAIHARVRANSSDLGRVFVGTFTSVGAGSKLVDISDVSILLSRFITLHNLYICQANGILYFKGFKPGNAKEESR